MSSNFSSLSAALGINNGFTSTNTRWFFLSWMPIIFYVPLKNRITVPRFGYVKFDSEHGSRGRKITGFLVLFFLVVFVLGIVVFLVSDPPAPPELLWIRENTMFFYGLVGVLGFGLAGLISGIRRLFVYALLSIFLMVTGQLLDFQEFVPFLLLGGTIFVTGLILLVRFMRKYPVAAED